MVYMEPSELNWRQLLDSWFDRYVVPEDYVPEEEDDDEAGGIWCLGCWLGCR